MNMFEKIWWTIFIVLLIFFTISTIISIVTDGYKFLRTLFYPIFIFIFLTVLYMIQYFVLKHIWDIDIPFFEKF